MDKIAQIREQVESLTQYYPFLQDLLDEYDKLAADNRSLLRENNEQQEIIAEKEMLLQEHRLLIRR